MPRPLADQNHQRAVQLAFDEGIKALRDEQQAFLEQFQHLLYGHGQFLQSAMAPTKSDAVAPVPHVVTLDAPLKGDDFEDLHLTDDIFSPMDYALAKDFASPNSERSIRVARKHGSILARKVDLNKPEETDQEADRDLHRLEEQSRRNLLAEHYRSGNRGMQFHVHFQLLVSSHWFELVFGSAIILNTVVMAAEMQYGGEHVGADMKYPLTTRPPQWMGTIVDGLNEFLLWIFVLELLCNLAAYHIEFFTKNKLWNWMDFFVVVTGVVDRFFTIDVGLDPLILRLLRLIKLTRFLKMFRLAGSLQTVSLILKSVKASKSTLVWSMFFLFMLQCVAGMFVTQLLSGFVKDPNNDLSKRQAVYRYYGTFTKTQFTMFEVTHVSYSPAARVLTDNVSERWAWFFLFYRIGIAFTFVQVIRAIFIQSTLKVADRDRELMLHNKRTAKQETTSKLRDVFTMLVGEASILDEETFLSALKQESTKVWFSALDIDCNDPHGIWELLDLNGDGFITLEQFSAAAATLRGPAQTLDLYLLHSLTARVDAKLDTLLPHEFRGHTYLEPTAKG